MFNNEPSASEVALQRDIRFTSRLRQKIALCGAIAVAAVGAFLYEEVKENWNFSDAGADIAIELFAVGFGIGGVYGNLGVYAETKDRVNYRLQMMDRKPSGDS